MTTELADGVQIVPGYRLEIRLGKGGFGEVWRATGPGRVPVALKIIAAKGSRTGEREFRSLDLIRDLRHPNLLPVQAYWLLDDDGQVIEDDRLPSCIVIAMMLGDKNLRQRLDACRQNGLAGIPPRELLDNMRDAAKGIDFLNRPIHKFGDRVVAIQHRDIKPENLMTVGGGLMVADFGIAGVMESDRAHTTSAAMTCYYAAPELFDFTASAWTDQYALAITYSELRCGELPFPPNTSPVQLIRIHTESRHDFSRLTPGEQAVLKRATAKVPEDRYPTCLDMLADLDAAVRAANALDTVLPLHSDREQSAVATDQQGTQAERTIEIVLVSNPKLPWGDQSRVTTQLQATQLELERSVDQSKVPTEIQATDLEPRFEAQSSNASQSPWGDQSKVPTELQPTQWEGPVDQSKVETEIQATDLEPRFKALSSNAPQSPWGDQSKVETEVETKSSGKRQEGTSPGDPACVIPTAPPLGSHGRQTVGSVPATSPSRTPVWIGSAVAVIVVAGLIAWAIPKTAREPRPPELASREPPTNEAPVLPPVSVAAPSTDQQPTLAVRLAAAREQAATAVKEKRYRDVVKALEPVFEHASATSEDYIMRGNSSLALADSEVSPAENYARAAADFEQAERPREQLRALTQMIRWLLDHNFSKQAITPLRQALDLKNSADVQGMLCQALLATGDAKAAREEGLRALAVLPSELSDSDIPNAARLQHIVGRASLALSNLAEADPELAARVESLDLEADQHLQNAIALASTAKLPERAEWQDELSAFRKLPRMVAREESRLRKEQIAALLKSVEQSPGVAATWLQLAELEKLDGQTKSATTHFGRGYSLQALTLARADKLADAIKSAALATEHEADFAELFSAQALIAAGQQRDRDTTKLLDEAMARTPEKSPGRSQVLADRALAYSRLAAGHFARGLALRKTNHANEAIAAFTETIALEPKHVGALLNRSQLIIEDSSSTPAKIEQATQDIETAFAAAITDEQTAEAHYVRSTVLLRPLLLAKEPKGATVELALLKVQREVLDAFKLQPANPRYDKAVTKVFNFAEEFDWSDAQRKADSESLRRDLDSLRKKSPGE
ncbi:MAG: protein kinase domain-containing protein [Planctomycetaceae bacterium]